MNFAETEIQSELRALARRAARQEILPLVEADEETETFRPEIIAQLGALGLCGVQLPEAYGGSGLGYSEYAVVIEELAAVCASYAISVSVTGLAQVILNQFGNEAQKSRWIPELASGRAIGAFSLSEASSGSDAGSLLTTARRDGDHYVLNGTKLWVTQGDTAAVILIMARTGEPGPRGISTFIVERGTPGLAMGKREKKMGLSISHTMEIVLENCRIPVANLVGKEGEGFKIAMAALNSGRITIGAIACGVARSALEVATSHARERQQFGKPIGDFQGRVVHARRHGGGSRERPSHVSKSRVAPRRGPSVRDPGRDEQDEDDGHGDEGNDRRRSSVGRLGLHARLSGRALHARGQGDADLRRYESDPAPRRRARLARGRRQVGEGVRVSGVTAARLGASPLAIDWTDLGSRTPDAPAIRASWDRLKARVTSGEIGFYDTPVNVELSQIDATEKLVRELGDAFTDCLFLGIGGSSLGPLSLLAALPEQATRAIRFHFVENPDPLDWTSTIAKLDPARALVCIVTKSGMTFETLAQSLLALKWTTEARWRSHVIAITDPAKGDLRKWADQNGVRTLAIAPSIGGRFSIFTPVGLFALALQGLDARAFLAGAAQVRDTFEKADRPGPDDRLPKHPLLCVAEALLEKRTSHPTHVCMPYSTRLRGIGQWFVQLWGESLGKAGKGFTPLAALGAVDQHSLLQLLSDGPNDKVTWFLALDTVPDEVRIPRLYEKAAQLSPEAFRLLEGHTLHELLTVEYRSIARVLTQAGRPHFSIKIEKLDERAMGALYFAFACLTAYTGTRWGMDPFDQPGVEQAKVYIREQLQTGAHSSQVSDEEPVHRLRLHLEREHHDDPASDE